MINGKVPVILKSKDFLNKNLQGHQDMANKTFGKHGIIKIIETIHDDVDAEGLRLSKCLERNNRPTGDGSDFVPPDRVKLF